MIHRVILALLSALLLAGCASAVKPPDSLDRANLVVHVTAEPKQGARDDTSQGYSGSGTVFGQFERVDYDHLDEIVVWVERAGDSACTVLNLSGDASTPGVRFATYEDGTTQNVAGKFAPTHTGYVELFTDSSDKPACRAFVAPSSLARVSRAGQSVSFDNVEPGAVTVCTWHPRLPGSRQTVSLVGGKTTRVDAVVSVNLLPKIR